MLNGRECNPFPVPPPVDARIATAQALSTRRAVHKLNHRRESGDFGSIGDDGEGALLVDVFNGGAAIESSVPNHDSVSACDCRKEMRFLGAGNLLGGDMNRRVGSDFEDKIRFGVRRNCGQVVDRNSHRLAVVENPGIPKIGQGDTFNRFSQLFAEISGRVDPKSDFFNEFPESRSVFARIPVFLR